MSTRQVLVICQQTRDGREQKTEKDSIRIADSVPEALFMLE